MPDVVVLSGDLAEGALPSEFAQAERFLDELSHHLELARHRVVIVPGNHDVSWNACEAYFKECAADEMRPQAPYWPKWERHFAAMFGRFYGDEASIRFVMEQPWTLFEMPELGLVVAGLNSTMAESHQDGDHYGLVGEEQHSAPDRHRLAAPPARTRRPSASPPWRSDRHLAAAPGRGGRPAGSRGPVATTGGSATGAGASPRARRVRRRPPSAPPSRRSGHAGHVYLRHLPLLVDELQTLPGMARHISFRAPPPSTLPAQPGLRRGPDGPRRPGPRARATMCRSALPDRRTGAIPCAV